MILSLRQIEKSFGPTIALRGVDLALRQGEVHALIGENGAGKSTLMNILSGSLKADAGTMRIDGDPYQPANPLDARRSGLALIHQELSLMPHLTVAENILLGMENSRFGWLARADLSARAASVLEYFRHGDLHPETLVRDLPIASRQVVEICRAVAAKARIILMDEPTSSLHRDDVRRLFSLIEKLRSDGVSIIYISHFLEEVREIGDSFTVLRDGQSVGTGKVADVTDSELVAKMVGRAVEYLFPARKARIGETILEVENLSVSTDVEAAGFSLRRGEILGIFGLMGSGRTALVKGLFGLERLRAGAIKVNGRSAVPGSASPSIRLAEGFGYLSEDRKDEGLALTLSIADNLTMTGFASCSRFGWLDVGKQFAQAANVIEQVGIKTADAGRPVMTLSGGNQQKVAIGRLVHQDADILLLDEPTRGIDIGSKAQIYELIAHLAEQGKAILLVSSYLPELFGICDRLAVMSNGRLSAAKPVAGWTPESVMQAAIALD